MAQFKVKSPQARVREILFDYTGQASPVLNFPGTNTLTITRNGTGDHTLTLVTPAVLSVIPGANAINSTANILVEFQTVALGSVRILTKVGNTGTLTDARVAGCLQCVDALSIT